VHNHGKGAGHPCSRAFKTAQVYAEENSLAAFFAFRKRLIAQILILKASGSGLEISATVKIEDLLMPSEKVGKVQEKISICNMAGTLVGDLYLTDKRLIFMHSKSWSVLSPTAPYLSPGGVVLGKNIMIPLQDVKSVSKTVIGYLKVQADKEISICRFCSSLTRLGERNCASLCTMSPGRSASPSFSAASAHSKTSQYTPRYPDLSARQVISVLTVVSF
jgi:hypothetical protein